MSDIVEWVVGALISALFVFLLFQCPSFKRYIYCEEIPPYHRNYEVCF